MVTNIATAVQNKFLSHQTASERISMYSKNDEFDRILREKKEEQNLDKDEYIRYFKCHYQEMLELVDMGYINDANSLITIEKSRQVLSKRR